MSTPVWFDGICDVLLAKVKQWHDNYERGEIRGTRKFLDVDGIKDVPVKYLHEIPVTQREAEYLIRIMKELRPRLPLTDMLAPLPNVLRKYRMKMQGQTPAYLVPFAYYKPEVREILRTLEEAKAAAKNTTVAQTVDGFLAERKKTGGHLFKLED